MPVGAALDAAGRLRRALAQPYRAPVPVICVGNLVVGGAGKTPVVLSLIGVLRGMGIAAHVVMRGYGGRLVGPVQVDPSTHDSDAVGDEALFTAGRAPCWVARDRAAGVRAAANAGAGAVLLDDGFQNPSVGKDLSLVVVDGDYGFGNGRLLPAGPLRESVAQGLARADAVIRLGKDSRVSLAACDRPILHAELAPLDAGCFAGARVAAFAGIGRPEKFFATLRQVGASVVMERRFPDHHRFAAGELSGLRRAAKREDAVLVTTEKDYMRLPESQRDGIEMLRVEVRWHDRPALIALIAPVTKARAVNGS
jgi:tetraacyldisaccharide 4'-kinase